MIFQTYVKSVNIMVLPHNTNKWGFSICINLLRQIFLNLNTFYHARFLSVIHARHYWIRGTGIQRCWYYHVWTLHQDTDWKYSPSITKAKAILLNPNSDSRSINKNKTNSNQPCSSSDPKTLIQYTQQKPTYPSSKHMKMLQFKLILDDPGGLAKTIHSRNATSQRWFHVLTNILLHGSFSALKQRRLSLQQHNSSTLGSSVQCLHRPPFRSEVA
jgi:hypothetical protein